MPSLEAIPQNYHLFNYDTERWPFDKLVAEILRVPHIESLEMLPAADEVTDREHDQHTEYHDEFYNSPFLEKEFLPLYKTFLQHWFMPWDMYFQTVPTFRVSLIGSKAVGEQHRDRDFGHSEFERNYWVPLTRAYGTNSLYIEDENVEAVPGQFVSFDGANLSHGNMVNQTPISRVSFDFRAIRKNKFVPGGETVSAGIPMTVGKYWMEIPGAGDPAFAAPHRVKRER